MESHDWMTQKLLDKILGVQISAANQGDSAAAGSIRLEQLTSALAPLYAALPKNEHGHLSNGTARYALHRHFTKEHGWSVKGLEPAGAAWIQTLEVSGNVREITKYMVPTYMQDRVLGLLDGKGFDLKSLAIMASTIEHLVSSEMKKYLYSVFTTLQVPTAGTKNEEEADWILANFIMVYAFGSNLEASMAKDMEKSKRYLDKHHGGWLEMLTLARELRAKHQLTGAVLDFAGILRIAEAFADRYMDFQSQDCTRAKRILGASPDIAGGRIPVSALQPSLEPGHRTLFSESAEYQGRLGVLDGDKLIVPNYIASQTMCLSTASFYTVCCPNECDQFLEKLERDLTSAAPSADAVVAALKQLVDNSLITDARLADLQEIEKANGGSVPLHGSSFGGWLHRIFPLECATPGADFWDTNPKTASDWLTDPGPEVKELEDMMDEIADSVGRYTKLGQPEDLAEEEADAEGEPEPDVLKLRSATQGQRMGAVSDSGLRPKLRQAFKLMPLISMFLFALALGKSAFMKSNGHVDDLGKARIGAEWLA